MSTKKFPKWESLRKARITAVKAHNPIAADKNMFEIQKNIWLKFYKCCSPE
jgi:hypothetical protein